MCSNGDLHWRPEGPCAGRDDCKIVSSLVCAGEREDTGGICPAHSYRALGLTTKLSPPCPVSGGALLYASCTSCTHRNIAGRKKADALCTRPQSAAVRLYSSNCLVYEY